MRRVVLESPYAGNIESNIEYARLCVRDSLLRNEAPIASHLLYTQKGILNDDVQEQRIMGINAGLAWLEFANLHVFYIDYGYSLGMLLAKQLSEDIGMHIEERKIFLLP